LQNASPVKTTLTRSLSTLSRDVPHTLRAWWPRRAGRGVPHARGCCPLSVVPDFFLRPPVASCMPLPRATRHSFHPRATPKMTDLNLVGLQADHKEGPLVGQGRGRRHNVRAREVGIGGRRERKRNASWREFKCALGGSLLPLPEEGRCVRGGGGRG